MKKNKIFKFAVIPLILITLQSCFVAKNYSRPEVVQQSNYRMDTTVQDSTTLADLSWRELFTDSLLASYIERGLKNNTDIRIAMQQVITANAYYNQGKAGYLPTLNAAGRVNYQKLSKNSQFGSFFSGSITQYELSGVLSWEADIWGKIRSNKRAAQASYLQSVAAHQAVSTQLIANIASVYFQLIAFDEQLRIAEQTVEYRESSLETTKALKDAGNVTEVGVKQTEAQLHSARALVVETQQNIKLLENTMSILLGEEPGEIQRNSINQQQIAEVDLKVGFPVQLLRKRPDVIASEYNLVNAFELTNVAKSNFYPSLTITSATAGIQSLELDKLFSVNSIFATVVGGITQPILNGRRIRTQYEVAKSQQEIAYLNFRQSILNASREVSDALYTFEASEERIDLKTLELQAYDTAVVYSEELLNNGLVNYLEVITARQSALNAQLALINARFNRLNAVVDLYKALGGGWE
ncbi:MAG TPA: efflux transporter outer membrane subunit [Ohtaekwangia sp.]|nr:efflux transporter outer membrane subunit [Ohtaekwangia sp.]